MLLDFSQYTHPENVTMAENSFDESVLSFIKKWYSQDEFTVQTSGSTGTPKAIAHSKEAMINSAKLTGEYFGFKQGNTALLCLPADKIAGIMMIVRAIVWKLKLYTINPKLQLDLSLLPMLDFASLIPPQAIENYEQLSCIKTILLGGTGLTPTLEEKLKKHSSNFYLSYGMTETVSHIALRKINGENATPLFSAMPNVSLTTDKDSRLCISAPHLNIEYLQTNDIVKLHTSNTFEFIGRFDNIINSGGLKINIETIEKQVSKIISQPFYIKGIKDERLGEKVALFIEGKPWQKEQIDILNQQLKSIQPKQAIPKEIIFKECFSYTSTGKIKRI